MGVGAAARRAGAIGDDNPAERLSGGVEARSDAVVRHDLDIVLMGANAEVRDAGEGVQAERVGSAKVRSASVRLKVMGTGSRETRRIRRKG